MASFFHSSIYFFPFYVSPVADRPHGALWRGRGRHAGGCGGAEKPGGGEVGKLLPLDVAGSLRGPDGVRDAAPSVPSHPRILPRQRLDFHRAGQGRVAAGATVGLNSI